jgi:hypothetical protein
MVRENTRNRETEKEVKLDRRTPLNSLHFFMASKFLLGICPIFLETQVSKCLLDAASRTRRATEAHVLLYQMSCGQALFFEECMERHLGKSHQR